MHFKYTHTAYPRTKLAREKDLVIRRHSLFVKHLSNCCLVSVHGSRVHEAISTVAYGMAHCGARFVLAQAVRSQADEGHIDAVGEFHHGGAYLWLSSLWLAMWRVTWMWRPTHDVRLHRCHGGVERDR